MDERANILDLSDEKKSIIDSLLKKGIITRELLVHAREVMKSEKDGISRSLTEVLVEDCGVDRETIYREIAKHYAFRIIDLSQETFDLERLAFVRKTFDALPEALQELAIKLRVLPYKLDGEQNKKLLVVTTDPTKREVNFIARCFPYPKFEICYTSLTDWGTLWQELRKGQKDYSRSDTARSQMSALVEEEEGGIDEAALEEEINRSRLVNLIENVLTDAARVGASDVHIIPRGSRRTEFHFRIDGKLSLWHSQEDVRAEAVAAVVKDRAKNLDRFERNRAQDGFAQMIVDGKTIRYRFSVIPIIGMELKNKLESIVIRVLQEPRISTNLEDLGFDPHSFDVFQKAISKPYGMIIVTGPTGSGKSTTLVGALRTVMSPQLNIITVEDPVEYSIEGARQVKLNPKLDFDGALRAILRHDPDIVMVGEIRDRITAEIAIKLSNTGHLTFSTLHTNDAPSAVARLYKMGIEPFLIAYAINIVLSQRLLRLLCNHCKSPITEVDLTALRRIGFPENEAKKTTFYRPIGCGRCLGGFRGRIAVHEALYFSKDIRHLILEAGDTIDEEVLRKQGLKEGMQTLRMNALRLLQQGATTIEEVASTTMED